MAQMDMSQVTVGAADVTGAIFVAPDGTTLPTDATSDLDDAFELLGFTSDAGLGVSESRNKQVIRAWEGRTEVCSVVTEYSESVSFMPIQCNADVARVTWGADAVTVGANGAMTVRHHGRTLDPVAIVVETTPRAGIVKRYAGRFQLSERGEQKMDGTTPDGRNLVFDALPDSAGVTMYEYTAYTAG